MARKKYLDLKGFDKRNGEEAELLDKGKSINEGRLKIIGNQVYVGEFQVRARDSVRFGDEVYTANFKGRKS